MNVPIVIRKGFRYGMFAGIALLLLVLLFVALVWLGAFGKLPGKKDLADIQNNNASIVLDHKGELLGKYYYENRTAVSYADMPPHLIDALICTEDVRFFEHKGVDSRSLARVLLKTVLQGDASAGGGSTISQQLIKNLYKREDFGKLSIPVNKVKEAIIASRLERLYDKHDILALYLNTVPFGEKVFGVEAAAGRFFSKSVSELTPEESALLVGMLKANTLYSPRLYPERATARRNVVLAQLLKYGRIDSTRCDSLSAIPLTLAYRAEGRHRGPAPYFREHIRPELEAIVASLPKKGGGSYDLYADGLKIYTSLDANMQQMAEAAVAKHLKGLQQNFLKDRGSRPNADMRLAMMKRTDRYRGLKAAGKTDKEIEEVFDTKRPMRIFNWAGVGDQLLSPMDSLLHYARFLQAGMMVMEPDNGRVRAWVGGINHQFFQYDHVTSSRQAGSTFKPFVYAAALENGKDPCSYISNERETYEDYSDWSPRNASGRYEGYYSMQGGLANSVNTVAVKLLMETGINDVMYIANKMGIKSDLPAYPSLALGSGDLSILELLPAYTPFFNKGKFAPATYILRIEDRNGNVLLDLTRNEIQQQVIDRRNAESILRMMQHTVDSGTARSLKWRYGLKGEFAGKTGTTQSYTDGWFIGASPELLAGVWVGADNPSLHFTSSAYGQGSRMALPIWADFFSSLQKDKEYNALSEGTFEWSDSSVIWGLDCPDWRAELPEASFWDLLFKWDSERDKFDIRPYGERDSREDRKLERKRKRQEKKRRKKNRRI